jgi:hypothetical protein
MVGMPSSIDQAVAAVAPIIEHAQRILERCREDGDFPPTFFVFTAHRGVDIIGMEWESPDAKDRAAVAMRLMAVAAQPLGLWGVMLITDSRVWEVNVNQIAAATGRTVEWVEQLLRDEPDEIRRFVKPTDCLLVSLETYLGDYQVQLKYDRLEDGRVAWHAPDVKPPSQQSEGRFVNILPPLPSTGAQA